MGESAACLVRSFSQPSPTLGDEKKGDYMQRALTESVSFGRFMSESLDWERWSAFTQNRYLEEAEKYSKPGSVAEKKAYFEAHFKRRRAAALLEQQSAAACTVSETANVEDKDKGSSSLECGQAQRGCDVFTEKTKEAEIQISNPVVPTDQSGNFDDTSVESNLGETNPGAVEKAFKPLVLLGNSLEVTDHVKDDVCSDDIIVSKKEDKACNKDDSASRNSALGDKTPEVSSSKLLTKEGASKCPPSVKPIVPVQLKNSDKTPRSKCSSMGSGNKRRSYITSLHMPTLEDVSSGLRKIQNPKISRAPAKKYKNGVLPQTSTKASVNGVFKTYATAPSAANKRIVKGDPISEARRADEKVHPPSSNYSKPSTLLGNKARTPTVPSSFTFKSEERAVKRREILEQKAKLKDIGKHKMHAAKPQAKKRSNDKDFQNSIALETTKGVETPLRNITKDVEAPLRSITKKIPTARPCFPKIEERCAAFKVQDNNSIRPPWRLSAKTDGLNDFTGKNIRQPSHYSKGWPQKNMSENASPNIQF